MIEEMVGLGFKRIELSHGIRILLVPGILKAVEEGIVEISSVHNFCPLPGSVQHAAPNLYQPSSTDSRERDLWVRYTKQTLDFTAKVGCKRVVMHSGSVWFFFVSPETRLEKWIGTQENLTAINMLENQQFIKRRDRAMKRIRKSSDKAMGHINAGYAEVLPLAREKGIRLCLENREGLEELPLDATWPEFIEKLPEQESLGYWHDTGHAQIKHQFGLLDHRTQLESMADQLTGFHLHDVSAAGRDHQIPGTGVIDFRMIREFVRPEHVLVLELSPLLTAEEVLASRDHILSTFT